MTEPTVSSAAQWGTGVDMKIFRLVATVGIAKKLYDVSRTPENQRRIKQAVETVRSRRAKSAR